MASKLVRVTNLTKHTDIAQRVRVADSFFSRFAGLLFSPPLQPGEGLLLMPCSSIHMIGMSFPLDVIFLDRNFSVVGLAEGIAPGQISRHYPTAHSSLELPCGVIADSATVIGDTLEVVPA